VQELCHAGLALKSLINKVFQIRSCWFLHPYSAGASKSAPV